MIVKCPLCENVLSRTFSPMPDEGCTQEVRFEFLTRLGRLWCCHCQTNRLNALRIWLNSYIKEVGEIRAKMRLVDVERLIDPAQVYLEAEDKRVNTDDSEHVVQGFVPKDKAAGAVPVA